MSPPTPITANKTLAGFILLVVAFIFAALILFLEKPTGSLKGVVWGPEGKPLSGTRVSVDAWPLERSTTTETDGTFLFPQLPLGEYYLNAKKKGYEAAYLSQLKVTEGKVADVGTLALKELEPALRVDLWEDTKLPKDPVVLSVTGAKVQKISFQVYRLDLLKFLSSGGALPTLTENQTDPASLPGAELVKDWEFVVPEAEVPEFDLKVRAPLQNETGFFIIHALAASADRKNVFTQNRTVNKTDLGFAVKRDERQVVVYAAGLSQPELKGQVTIHLFPANGSPRSTTTDSDGLARISLQDLPPHEAQSMMVVATLGSNLAFSYAPDIAGGEEHGQGSPLGEEGAVVDKNLFAMIYTDRPIYRPAQEVYFKGIVRRRTATGTYDLIEPTLVNVILEDPRGEILQEMETELSSFGSFSGSFPLGEDPELGYYNIRATLNETEFKEDFEVDEYRTPEFKLEIRLEKPRYFAGDKIQFAIDAQYYFGAPVASEIEYTLYKSSYYYSPPDEEILPELWIEEAYAGGYGEYLQEGKIKTDAQGHAVVSYKTPEAEEDFRYTLRIRAKDISDRSVETEGDAVVTAGNFFFRTQMTQFLAYPHKPFPLTVLTRNYDNQPVAVKYQIRAERQKWDPIARDFSFRKATKVEGETDAKGEGKNEITLEQGGYYRLVIRGKDSEGRGVRYEDYLYVSGSAQDSEDFGVEGNIRIIAAQKKFQAGETAKVFIVGPKKNGKVLISLEGARIYRDFVVTLDGFSKEIEIPLEKDWIPTIYVTATALGTKEFYTGMETFAISPKEHFLTVDIKPSAEKFQPGGKISYQVTTRDMAGNPVPAEISLGVVDEKIYALRADPTNIRKFFWGARPNRVGMNFSFSGYYSGGIGKEDRSQLRRNFKDTAYWTPTVVTDAEGKAEISFSLPDNLTTWRATVVAATDGTAVGQQKNLVIASKPLIARLATPRFFRERDQLHLKAILHNYTEQAQTLQVSLGLENLKFLNPEDDKPRTLTLPPKGMSSLTFPVKAETPGEAKVQFLAKNDQVSDGLELTIPVLPFGFADHAYDQGEVPSSAPPTGATAGKPASAKMALKVPPKTDAARSQLSLTLDTNLVGQLLGSLNYLVTYPYGCVEQTLSSFLPAMMVSRLYQGLGFSDPSVEKKLPRVMARALRKISRMQNPQGGWGWWQHDATDPFMTAYAMYGLIRARELGQKVEPYTWEQGLKGMQEIIEKGVEGDRAFMWTPEETRYFVHYVATLAGMNPSLPATKSRAQQSALTQALYVLILEAQGYHDQAVQTLENLTKRKQCNEDLCHFSAGPKREYDDTLVTAWVLQAILKTTPGEAELKKEIVRWLLAQREGGRWRHTLETAMVLYALSEYAQGRPGAGSTEAAAIRGVLAQLSLNGAELESINVTSPHFSRKFTGCAVGTKGCETKGRLPLKLGENSLEIVNLLPQPLYFQTGFLSFSTEENLAPVSTGVSVKREYVSLSRDPNTSSGFKSKALSGKIKKGEAIGVRLTLESPTNLSYLMVEDPLPSGFEVMKDVSFDTDLSYSPEYTVQDEKIAFFITYFPKGKFIINYVLIPELAGTFYVMPTSAEEMYRPEVRGSGASEKLEVVE